MDLKEKIEFALNALELPALITDYQRTVAFLMKRASFFDDMQKRQSSGLFSVDPEDQELGIICIDGVIGWNITPGRMQNALKEAQDAGVKKCILSIDSPGGTVSATEAIYEDLMNFKEQTGISLTASIEEYATSGGYYLAAATDKIYAARGSIVGSIGCRWDFMNWSEAAKQDGYEQKTFKSGQFKDFGNPWRKMTPEEENYAQASVNESANEFFQVVGKARGLMVDQVKKLEARVFYHKEALANGLIDGILSMAQVKGKLKGQAVQVVTNSTKSKITYIESATMKSNQNSKTNSAMDEETKKLIEEKTNLSHEVQTLKKEKSAQDEKIQALNEELIQSKTILVDTYGNLFLKAQGKALPEAACKALLTKPVNELVESIEFMKPFAMAKKEGATLVETTKEEGSKAVDSTTEKAGSIVAGNYVLSDKEVNTIYSIGARALPWIAQKGAGQ